MYWHIVYFRVGRFIQSKKHPRYFGFSHQMATTTLVATGQKWGRFQDRGCCREAWQHQTGRKATFEFCERRTSLKGLRSPQISSALPKSKLFSRCLDEFGRPWVWSRRKWVCGCGSKGNHRETTGFGNIFPFTELVFGYLVFFERHKNKGKSEWNESSRG